MGPLDKHCCGLSSISIPNTVSQHYRTSHRACVIYLTQNNSAVFSALDVFSFLSHSNIMYVVTYTMKHCMFLLYLFRGSQFILPLLFYIIIQYCVRINAGRVNQFYINTASEAHVDCHTTLCRLCRKPDSMHVLFCNKD